MLILVEQLLKQVDGREFTDYVQKDHFSDLKQLCGASYYAMLQMIEVKDLLLGQFLGRQGALDAK